MDGSITTYTGVQFYPLAPRVPDICITDIAHHLSLMVRWAGATREPYSIAQHSFHVAQLVAPEHRLWALLHDASEAYLLDLPRPLKHSATFANYRAIEAHLQTAIFQTYGLSGAMPDEVSEADDLMLVAEAQDLMLRPPTWVVGRTRAPFSVTPWPAARAERVFLKRFAELMQARSQVSMP